MSISIVPLTPDRGEALAALFDAAGSPCFCRFWHFEGSNNEWLERCATSPRSNRDDLLAALTARSDAAVGVLAIEGDEAIGWAKLAPAASVPKIYGRRLYRNLPCFEGDRTGVFVLACFLVHPAHRHRGVATALVEGAVRVATTWGGRAIEALPRRPAEPVGDEELWTGPMKAFAANGFREVHDFAPYPVLRRELP